MSLSGGRISIHFNPLQIFFLYIGKIVCFDRVLMRTCWPGLKQSVWCYGRARAITEEGWRCSDAGRCCEDCCVATVTWGGHAGGDAGRDATHDTNRYLVYFHHVFNSYSFLNSCPSSFLVFSVVLSFHFSDIYVYLTLTLSPPPLILPSRVSRWVVRRFNEETLIETSLIAKRLITRLVMKVLMEKRLTGRVFTTESCNTKSLTGKAWIMKSLTAKKKSFIKRNLIVKNVH